MSALSLLDSLISQLESSLNLRAGEEAPARVPLVSLEMPPSPALSGVQHFPPPLVPHQTLSRPPSSTSRTIVIGDVHGCLAELKCLLAKLDVDHDNDVVIFVGDLVNKGAQSAETVEFVREMKNCFSVR